MEKALETKQVKELFRAILLLKNTDECAALLRDLCTLSEIREMAKRFVAAQMLQGKMKYREISEKTGLSTATVTRVSHWLHNGTGGYKLILERMK